MRNLLVILTICALLALSLQFIDTIGVKLIVGRPMGEVPTYYSPSRLSLGSPVPIGGAPLADAVEKYRVIAPEGVRSVYLRLYSLDLFDGAVWRTGLPISIRELKVRVIRGMPKEDLSGAVVVYTGPGDVPTVVADGVRYYVVREVYVLRGRIDRVEVVNFGELDLGYRISGDGDYAVILEPGEPRPPQYVGYLYIPPGVGVDKLLEKYPVRSLDELQQVYKRSFTYKWGVNPVGDPFEFLLKRGEGQCTLFATTFALAARRLGLPSRLVVGYTAEQISEGEFVSVLPHAWAEVWANSSWVTYDPTPSSTWAPEDRRRFDQSKMVDAVITPREVLKGDYVSVNVTAASFPRGAELCVDVSLDGISSSRCAKSRGLEVKVRAEVGAGKHRVLVRWRLVGEEGVLVAGEHNDVPLEGTYSADIVVLERAQVRVVRLLPELTVEVRSSEGAPLNATVRFNDQAVKAVNGRASCSCVGMVRLSVERPYLSPTVEVLVVPSWVLLLLSAAVSLIGLLLYEHAHVVLLYLVAIVLTPYVRRFPRRSMTVREYFEWVFKRAGRVKLLEEFLEWYERRSYS